MSGDVVLNEETRTQFIELSKTRKIFLEGNIIKVLSGCEDEKWISYLDDARSKDDETRRKRLEVTRTVQDQNKELQEKAEENDRLMNEVKSALAIAEAAKEEALEDLNIIQQKSQTELISHIVTIALWVIIGTGIITTGMYLFAMMMENSTETTLIGNTWSNLFGILLTNSFSIIGTIMGVKYAQNEKESKELK
jgi:hypothetical protein